MHHTNRMLRTCSLILFTSYTTIFSAASDETSSSRSLIPSTASHHDTVTDFITTMNTPELFAWLQQRQRAGRTLPEAERVRIRAGLRSNVFDSDGSGRMPHFEYRDKLNPIEQYQYLDIRGHRSLLGAIYDKVDRDKKALRTLASIKQKLATKDTAQSDDELPTFHRFGPSDLKQYIEDRDALPETSVTCLKERIAILERDYTQSMQDHEEYKSEITNILDILDDFARRDLRENHAPLLVACLPFMACRYTCNPDWD